MRRIKLTSATPGPGGRDISGPIGPDAFQVEAWLEVGRPKSSWQQQRVISYLAKMYPNSVPDECPRKQLLRDLGKGDPALARLDWKTLQRAIKAHKASLADSD